jgi:hypothetical protein
MLLIDGVKYEVWAPPSEDEFERIVKEHAQGIFGEQSEYFGKQKLESKLGKGSVPDGFVIMFGEPPCWHIVEVELSFHDLHRHIVEQASRFIIGIKNPQTQRKIVDAIYEEIKKDDFLERKVRKASGTADIYKLLTDLISKPPVLTIIIEKRTGELDEALSALAHPQIKVVEFQTFTREGIGLGAHAHLFEPLYLVTMSKATIVSEVSKSSLDITGNVLEVIVRNPSCIKFHLFYIPKHMRRFFPGYKVPFKLDTDIGEIETYVSSAPGSPPHGDPDAGVYIQANLPEWYRRHPEIKVGDKVVFEVIEPMKRYRLKKA